MSLVSVLVPAYNAADTIGETLASAAAQTHRSLEIIVVDDGSTDATAGIVRQAARSDPRITLVQQDNAGVAAARNTALARAGGTYVAPLDADDLWHPDKITRQLRRMEQADGRAGLIYCWSVDIDDRATVVDRRLDLDRFEGDVYAALVLANFVGNASVPLIRKADLEAVGGWNSELRRRGAQGCEDWQVYLRLAERTDYALEPAFLVGYRQTARAMSRQVSSMRRSYRLVLNEAKARHRDLPPELFRWSEAAFDLYAFELLEGLASMPRRLAHLAAGVVRDPSWLGRPSTRRKARRWLKRMFTAAPPEPLPAPIGRPFSDLSPDAYWHVPEGTAISARRAFVAALSTRDRARAG